MRNFRSQLCHWNVLENAILRIGSRSSRFVWIADKAWVRRIGVKLPSEFLVLKEWPGWAHARRWKSAVTLGAHVWFDRPNIFTPPISYTFKKVKRDDAWEREHFSDLSVWKILDATLWVCSQRAVTRFLKRATWPRLFLHNEVINSCPIVNLEKLLVRAGNIKSLCAHKKACGIQGLCLRWAACAHLNFRIKPVSKTLFEPQNKALTVTAAPPLYFTFTFSTGQKRLLCLYGQRVEFKKVKSENDFC